MVALKLGEKPLPPPGHGLQLHCFQSLKEALRRLRPHGWLVAT